MSRARPSKSLVQYFQKYTNMNGNCQNEWGLMRRATQQLDKLNPGQKLISVCPSDDQFQSYLLNLPMWHWQCPIHNRQEKYRKQSQRYHIDLNLTCTFSLAQNPEQRKIRLRRIAGYMEMLNCLKESCESNNQPGMENGADFSFSTSQME